MQSTEIDHAQAPPPTSFWTKMSYGIGGIAYGAKDGGFNYFLLIFYSQIIGLNPFLTSLAIWISLVVDALSDPLVGYWSDNTRSRWGRRHPFMYASIIPITCSYFLLWSPPDGWSDQQLFIYLLVLAILIRTFITLFETPSSALAPDLTRDYDERSQLISYRFLFGWSGGNLMSIIMFFAVFPAFATELIPDGRFNQDAYTVYGYIASATILLGITVSSLGTHSRVKYLKLAPPKRQLGVGRVFKEIYDTLAERDFVVLFLAALFGAIATGLNAGLTYYFLTYFWGFTSIEIGIVMLGVFGAAVIGFGLAPVLTRTIGKKNGAMIVGLVACLGAPLPIVLRLIDVLPPNGTPFVFWFVLSTNVIGVGLTICFQILTTSMLADLVEVSELKTGRRSEGVFTAAMTFVKKAVQGLGLMAASLVLTLAQFPEGADIDAVPSEAIWKLGAYFVPVGLFFWLAMIAIIAAYRNTREQHENNVQALQERSHSIQE